MASVLKVDKLDPQSGTALEIGTSGDTVSIPSGATLDISSATLTPPATLPASSGVNLTALNASNLGSGTVPTARLGSGTASSSTILYGDQTYKTEPSGFDVSTITGATALATQPASTDEIVLSDAGTLKRLDIKHIQNTPAFAAVPSSTTATAHNTYTKVQCDTETFDSDGTYDNSSNYRFTPAVAGKYFIYGMVCQGSGTGVSNMQRQYTAIYKNGSKVVETRHDGRNTAYGDTFSGTATIILDLDGDDYVELYTKPVDGGAANCNYYTGTTCFGGFRISGVA